MIKKKDIIDNQLLKEIIAIRINTLWRMLALKCHGEGLPLPNDEGATGKFDNKGAIFIPGGLIYQDVDEKTIQYHKQSEFTPALFGKQIRSALQYDNATLLFKDGIAKGINLDSGFFSKAARTINIYKKAAFRRKKKISSKILMQLDSEDIIKSHCPTYFSSPYGARTRISTCVSFGLIDPSMFFVFYKTELKFSQTTTQRFSEQFDRALQPCVLADGTTLFPPYVVVCHDTRYNEYNYTGLTRILGLGKFGEFATLSFERIDNRLVNELRRKKIEYSDEDIVADYEDHQILCLLRVYAPTNPGRRSSKHDTHIISAETDLRIDTNQIYREAKEQYNIG
ncbi:MAG TPA: hypothetical protein DHV36_12010 [Desulfobacteraceae bacterium]|nr:hypothetical protein [Desulfobacteraceae bacterium]